MNPYISLPDHAFWRKAVAGPSPEAVNPVVEVPFRISMNDKIATAGSCFAQHIAAHLSQSGYNYLVTEKANPLLEVESHGHNYGVYTARYGNIYTTRQLLQLFDRAYGTFEPRDSLWKNRRNQWVDPFRPTIEPEGFFSSEELLADRAQHFSKVREAFENLDYFVFTLGLTECWQSLIDGAVFPVCPGVSGGTFSNQDYGFLNLDCAAVTDDTIAFIERLRSVNATAKVILTVSPIPLVASASGDHVLSATTLSKSVLRTAADQIQRRLSDIYYFPSYEIITGSFSRGRYFAEDLRSVLPEGVSHVMSVFMHSCTDYKEVVPLQSLDPPVLNHADAVEKGLQIVCDEEALDADFNLSR